MVDVSGYPITMSNNSKTACVLYNVIMVSNNNGCDISIVRHSLGRIVGRKSNHECEIIVKYKQLEQFENVYNSYVGRVIELVAIVFIFEISILVLAQTYSSATSSLVYLHMMHPHEQATLPHVFM